MYIYDDEQTSEVSRQDLSRAIDKMMAHIESEEFLKKMAEKLLYYWLHGMTKAEDFERERCARISAQDDYTELLERFKSAKEVIMKHGLIDEYNETWMEKEGAQ